MNDPDYTKHDQRNPGVAHNPVSRVLWVPIGKVVPNGWNPNAVATREMSLLHLSVKQDGFTMPVVTFYNERTDLFEIVDGFHRYTTLRTHPDLMEKNGGLLPIVVIDKPISDRMASTVRHNRARGKHSVGGMANMVYALLDEGWSDAEVCEELGLTTDEIVRLRHVSGFSKLFENVEYRRAWESRKQIALRRANAAKESSA
jgi:ParB-like chromosome segregation protein Spo0J